MINKEKAYAIMFNGNTRSTLDAYGPGSSPGCPTMGESQSRYGIVEELTTKKLNFLNEKEEFISLNNLLDS